MRARDTISEKLIQHVLRKIQVLIWGKKTIYLLHFDHDKNFQ